MLDYDGLATRACTATGYLLRRPRLFGIGPVSLLYPKLKYVRFFRSPSDSGKLPPKRFMSNSKSVK